MTEQPYRPLADPIAGLPFEVGGPATMLAAGTRCRIAEGDPRGPVLIELEEPHVRLYGASRWVVPGPDLRFADSAIDISRRPIGGVDRVEDVLGVMGEQDWTVTSDPPQPTQPPQKHTATIDGLAVEIAESPTGHCYWVVRGHLYDIEVDAHDYRPRRLSEAKAAGVRAAHRLYAAGVRGEKSFPVACCDRRFATRDAADQHEGEHAAMGDRQDVEAVAFLLPGETLAPHELEQLRREGEAREQAASESGDEETEA